MLIQTGNIFLSPSPSTHCIRDLRIYTIEERERDEAHQDHLSSPYLPSSYIAKCKQTNSSEMNLEYENGRESSNSWKRERELLGKEKRKKKL